jgi:hypothetical protein
MFSHNYFSTTMPTIFISAISTLALCRLVFERRHSRLRRLRRLRRAHQQTSASQSFASLRSNRASVAFLVAFLVLVFCVLTAQNAYAQSAHAQALQQNPSQNSSQNFSQNVEQNGAQNSTSASVSAMPASAAPASTAPASTAPASTSDATQSAPKTETLAGMFLPEITYTGFYAAPILRFIPTNDRLGTMIGGYGGWHFNHALMLGGGLSGMTETSIVPTNAYNGTLPQSGYLFVKDYMQWGGIIEYTAQAHQLLHWGGSLFVGSASASIFESRPVLSSPTGYGVSSSRAIFGILEPTAFVEFNILPSVRASFGASVRIMLAPSIGSDSNGESERMVFEQVRTRSSAFSLTMALKFGKL